MGKCKNLGQNMMARSLGQSSSKKASFVRSSYGAVVSKDLHKFNHFTADYECDLVMATGQTLMLSVWLSACCQLAEKIN